MPVTDHISEMMQDTIKVISWLLSLGFILPADPTSGSQHQFA